MNHRIQLIQGDITKLEVDAIVNTPPTVLCYAVVEWTARFTELAARRFWKNVIKFVTNKAAVKSERR